MDKIKIINANFFNNNYLNSKLFTSLNKICVKNQKNIASKYNSFFDSHRVYDYTNPLVIECKNDLKNSNIFLDNEEINEKEYLDILSKKEINEDDLLNSQVLSLEFYADFIKLFLLSSIKETIFLDDDTFICNIEMFLKSIINSRLSNIPCLNGGIDNMYNCNNLDTFKKAYEFRKKVPFIIKDSEFIKMFRIKEKVFSLNGICHIPFNESLIKKIFVIKKEEDIYKIKNLPNKDKNIEKYLLELHVPITEDYKSANFIEYYLFDEYGKQTFNKIKKEYNSEVIEL